MNEKKDPFIKNENTQKFTEQEIARKSEQQARTKLKILLNSDFKDFGVRFVNEKEYNNAIATDGVFTGRKVFIMSKGNQSPSFIEYLHFAKENWGFTAQYQTNWGMSCQDLFVYSLLEQKLKEAHHKAQKEKGETNIQERTLEVFREEVKGIIEDLSIIRRSASIKRRGTELRGNFPEQYLQIITDFLQNPYFLTEKKDNLRLLINAVSYIPKTSEKETENYHLALIFDLSQVSIYLHGWWGLIEKTNTPQNALLGAIAAMPDKELLKEIIAHSSRSGDLAHPVFDNQGRVRWPKT